MLAGLASYVILGHSERRQYDGETDDGVARKVASAVEHGPASRSPAVGERPRSARRAEPRGDRAPAAGRAQPA